MGNLASTDKVVTAEMLQAYHDDHVAPFLGGNVLGAQSRFKQSDIYSTSERIVGCWTDGRPLYQKTITFSKADLTSGEQGLLHNISNVNTIFVLNDKSYIKETTYGQFWQVTNWNGGTTENGIANFGVFVVLSDSTQIRVYIGSGVYARMLSADKLCITIQYTKTTDAAGSYYLAGENDYSTDEKIIGTWIDGKPIYRKVYTGITGAISGSGETLIVLDASYRLNGKKIINARGGLNYDVSSSDYGRVILPWYIDNTNYAMIQDSTTRGLVICARGNFFSNSEYAITVEYTKS